MKTILTLVFSVLIFTNTIAKTSPGEIAGIITNSNGEPLNSIEVVLTKLNGETVGKKITGKEGKYSFTNLAEGKYAVNIATPGQPVKLVETVELSLSSPSAEILIVSRDATDNPSSMISESTLSPETGDGKISGLVHNAEGKPLEAATASLMKEDGKTLVKVAMTGKDGKYEFENLPIGKYLVTISAVGFSTKQSEIVEIKADALTAGINKIELSHKAKSLSEVNVISARPYIEQKLDKLIVNVDASPSNAGATALEVLEKSPGVTVDNDGNISLKGKQGVIVMMDGKQTYLSGADLANVLRNMPASALDQIEIMTNPSSRYDASGNSGVLNIKTKKGRNPGANGSISVGTINGLFRYQGKEEMTWRPSVSANFNYKKIRSTFFLTLFIITAKAGDCLISAENIMRMASSSTALIQ